MFADQKKTIAAAFAALLALATGAAQAQPVSWYLGADIVQLTTDIDDKTGVPPIVTGSAKATTLRLKGGAHLLNWLDAEVHWIIPSSETYSTAGTTNKAETNVLALLAKPKARFGQLGVYGLLGIASTSTELSGVVVGDESATDLAYGLGLEYAFTRNLAGTIDYTRYSKKNFPVGGLSGGLDVDVSALGVGIAYTF